MPRRKAKEPSFEEKLQELESIVSRLESGEAGLEEIMADYTKGMELSGQCLADLQKAEKQMDLLLQEAADGTTVEQILAIEGEA